MNEEQDLFGIEEAPENPKERIKDDEIQIASPGEKRITKESSDDYDVNLGAFVNHLMNTSRQAKELWDRVKKLWEEGETIKDDGEKLLRIYSNKPLIEIVSEVTPALSGLTGKGAGASAAATGGAAGFSFAAPRAGMETAVASPGTGAGAASGAGAAVPLGGGNILFIQGMLLVISAQLWAIQSDLTDVFEGQFMQSVHELEGALKTAENAVLADVKAGHDGFLNPSYVDLNTKFNTLCSEVNGKIAATNPEDESMFRHLFGGYEKSVKASGSLEHGVHALVETIAVSSDLCSRIGPVVTYNDRIANLQALRDIRFDRLGEILRYVDDRRFSGFATEVRKLPGAVDTLIESQNKKPVLLVSGNELAKLMEKQNG